MPDNSYAGFEQNRCYVRRAWAIDLNLSLQCVVTEPLLQGYALRGHMWLVIVRDRCSMRSDVFTCTLPVFRTWVYTKDSINLLYLLNHAFFMCFPRCVSFPVSKQRWLSVCMIAWCELNFKSRCWSCDKDNLYLMSLNIMANLILWV